MGINLDEDLHFTSVISPSIRAQYLFLFPSHPTHFASRAAIKQAASMDGEFAEVKLCVVCHRMNVSSTVMNCNWQAEAQLQAAVAQPKTETGSESWAA